MWMFLLVVFLWILKFLADKSNEYKWETIYELEKQDTENGIREYVYVWHFFWDEVVPEVYNEARRLQIGVAIFPQTNPKQRGPMSRWAHEDNFYLIGEKLYGRNPYDEAKYRARRLLRNEGYNPYSAKFLFGLQGVKDQASFEIERSMQEYYKRPVEQQTYSAYARIGTEFALTENEEEWYLQNCQHIEWLPPVNRRIKYKRLSWDGFETEDNLRFCERREVAERRGKYNKVLQDIENQNEEIRYAYAWYYYWKFIVPQVYEQARKQGVIAAVIHLRQDLCQNFVDIGYALYQRHPEAHARFMSEYRMKKEGRSPRSGPLLQHIHKKYYLTPFEISQLKAAGVGEEVFPQEDDPALWALLSSVLPEQARDFPN